MNMTLEQMGKSLSKRPAMSVMIVLMFSLGLFLVMGTAGYFIRSGDRLDSVTTAYTQDEYRMSVADIEIMSAAYNSELTQEEWLDYVDRVKQYRDALISSSEWDFYTVSSVVNLSILDYKGPDSGLFGYQSFSPARDVQTLEDGSKRSDLNTFVISPAFFQKFGLRIGEGSDFSDYSKQWQKGDVMPIVLGWNFRDSYEVGELVRGLCLVDNEPMQYEIAGFLSEGSCIIDPGTTVAGEMISLDSYVLVPVADLSQTPPPAITDPNDENLTYNQKHRCVFFGNALAQTVTGVAVSHNTIPPRVGSVAASFGFSAGGNMKIMVLSELFLKTADSFYNVLLLAAIVIVAGSALCLTLNLSTKLMDSFYTYAVHQISGATLSSVKGFMAAEVAALILLSYAIAAAATLLIGDSVFSYTGSGLYSVNPSTASPMSMIIAAAVALAAGGLSLIAPTVKLAGIEFDTLLRGKE